MRPYFGKSEAEMMVVTDKALFITRDAAQMWRQVSDIPKFSCKGKTVSGWEFAWDPVHNLIYAIIGGSVWKLPIPASA